MLGFDGSWIHDATHSNVVHVKLWNAYIRRLRMDDDNDEEKIK